MTQVFQPVPFGWVAVNPTQVRFVVAQGEETSVLWFDPDNTLSVRGSFEDVTAKLQGENPDDTEI